MDFGALPPEINSGRMYLGPGPATLLAASAGWESLAAELTDAASGYQSVIASLTDESWLGPTSMSMAAAVTPYMIVDDGHRRAMRAGGHPGHGRRGGLRNGVRDDGAAAADRGQPRSAHGVDRDQHPRAEHAGDHGHRGRVQRNVGPGRDGDVQLRRQFGFRLDVQRPSRSPPQTTNPGGLAGQAGAVAQAAGTQAGSNAQTTTAQLISSVPQTLQTLATPGSTSGAGLSQAAAGTAASLGSSGAPPRQLR